MVLHPEEYLEDFRRAGARKIVFHYEATASPIEVIRQIRNLGMQAGLAVAIWEVLYESTTSYGISSGDVQFGGFSNTAVTTAAGKYIEAVNSADLTGVDALWLRTANNDTDTYTQDFIGPVVPEPGTLLLLGAGLLTLAGISRFKTRKK